MSASDAAQAAKRGIACLQAKQWDKAADLLRQALTVNQRQPQLLFMLALAYANCGEIKRSADTLVKLLKIDPTHEQALSMLAEICLPETRKLGIKRSPINKLIAEHKDVPALRTVAVRICRAVGDHVERLVHLEAIQRQGAQGENFLYEYGRTLRDNALFDRCLTLCDQALKAHPASLDIWKLRASVHLSLGHAEQALADCHKVLELSPSDHHARASMGIVRLLISDCRDGYEDYAANLEHEIKKQNMQSALPEWRGEALNGRRLLLWCTQGIGDIVMFSSLLPWFEQQNAHVTLALYDRAIPLFSRSFPKIPVMLHTPDMLTRVDAFDCHGILDQLMASALPHYTPAEHPPFLKADPAQAAVLRSKYKSQGNGKKLVGISWHTKNKETFSQRNIPLAQWQALLTLPDIQLVSLQYGDHAQEIEEVNKRYPGAVLHDASIDAMGDMDPLAAQIAAMDEVVSIQNSTVHLAGALGVKTTLMLSAASDWRWGLKRTDSQWYGSVTIERQEKLLDWVPVLGKVAERLKG